MIPGLLGLHHVTATVDQAQPDLDFCLGVLGLRLVKQTVNFDNHRVFHFYYGDRRGAPGTIWTTFPYHGQGVRVGTIGAGQVVSTAFSVPVASLPWWQDRLAAAGVALLATDARPDDAPRLRLHDPSGLVMELVGSEQDERAPWTNGGVGEEQAIRGLHSVALHVHDAGPTLDFLHEVLGCTVHHGDGDAAVVDVGRGGPGARLEVRSGGGVPRGINGIGTVHHVALAIGSEDEQAALREALVLLGVEVTPVRDRQYFRSIYFREPGGVLIEVATVDPGFTWDEPLDALGTSLRLPSWQEADRAAIAAGLPPIRVSPAR
ncbi:dioxygenase [Luteitalea sp. TBR-22]|uniref:VOC family protein n=1 Tax=Luteitalea sp. TBR-22 TaxID=2802971 RepID=UPI001EF41D27|nr:VOC family protein [Luteitalea sp. TBR-22]BCS34359.2 dioxygenase [Luteitalea sp. TBR-22]